MKISKVAVLPMNVEHPDFQNKINDMIFALSLDGWEFDYIILTPRKTLVVFARDKQDGDVQENKSQRQIEIEENERKIEEARNKIRELEGEGESTIVQGAG